MTDRRRISKLLSYVLRHRPDQAGIELDEQGWVAVDVLLAGLAAHGDPVSRAELDEVVATSDKQRFALSDDGTRIRASQGHSVAVDLGYPPAEPPELLYHGTDADSLPSIRAQGLRRRARHHVHLSATPTTARAVGARHGPPVVLIVEAGRMHRDGHVFHISANGVWLTDEVPPGYLREADDTGRR